MVKSARFLVVWYSAVQFISGFHGFCVRTVHQTPEHRQPNPRKRKKELTFIATCMSRIIASSYVFRCSLKFALNPQ